jgi:hypothetical protein
MIGTAAGKLGWLRRHWPHRAPIVLAGDAGCPAMGLATIEQLALVALHEGLANG